MNAVTSAVSGARVYGGGRDRVKGKEGRRRALKYWPAHPCLLPPETRGFLIPASGSPIQKDGSLAH